MAPTVVWALIASIQAGSATGDAVATITRNLAANIAALSVTPDITATVETLVNLSAAIAGVSLTPDISATIARTLIGLITAQSVTPAVTASVARTLIANIQGTSVTPDDLVLILAGLGVILDPGIVSVTPRRTFESFGPSLNWPVQLGEGNLGEEPLGEGTARRSRFVIESHTPVFSIEAK